MKIYFLSSTPCALTLNGAYFGITDGFERFATLSLKDRVFAQFTPENALPIGCFLTESLRFAPPKGFEVYLLPDGLALYARDFPPRDFTLHTIAQKRNESTLATLFYQGGLQLSVESEKGFFVSSIPPSFSDCTLDFSDGLILLRGKNTLALYTKTGACAFCESVLSYALENGELSALLPLSDALGRVAECKYRLSEDGCVRTAFAIRQARTAGGETDGEKIRTELLPFAFFESVLFGANYAEMLSPALLDKAEDIRAFLGDFIAVTPTDAPNVCGLVKEKGERLYEVVHYRVEMEDGKIADIKG